MSARVSIVVVGHHERDGVAGVVAALLAEPGADFEVVLVEPAPPACLPACYLDPRLHRFSGAGLSAMEKRALGVAACAAAQRVHVELCDGSEEEDALDAALRVRPALTLLRVLRAAAATAPTEVRS